MDYRDFLKRHTLLSQPVTSRWHRYHPDLSQGLYHYQKKMQCHLIYQNPPNHPGCPHHHLLWFLLYSQTPFSLNHNHLYFLYHTARIVHLQLICDSTAIRVWCILGPIRGVPNHLNQDNKRIQHPAHHP